MDDILLESKYNSWSDVKPVNVAKYNQLSDVKPVNVAGSMDDI